jgi:hypothetical protein
VLKKPRVVPVTSPIVAACKLCGGNWFWVFSNWNSSKAAHTQQVLEIRALHLIFFPFHTPSTPLKKNQWPWSSRLCTNLPTYLGWSSHRPGPDLFTMLVGTSVGWYFLCERTFHCGFDIINKDRLWKIDFYKFSKCRFELGSSNF